MLKTFRVNPKQDPIVFNADDGTGGGGSGLTPVPAAPAAAFTTNQNAAIGNLLRMNPTGGQLTVTLPAANAKSGPVGVKVQSNSNNGVVVTPAGADTIDGAATSLPALVSREYVTLYSDGISDWMVMT